MQAEQDKLLDIRLADRNLRDGALEQKDLDTHVAGLEDLADQADWTSYEEITNLHVAPLAAREERDGADDDRAAED